MANEFEAALLKHHGLIKQAQWRRLREIDCLKGSDGALKSPQDLYVRTHGVFDLLGDAVTYAEGLNRALQEKIGCNVLPRSADIVAAIQQNRRSDNPTADALYVALVEALKEERRPLTTYADDPIVWTPLGYASPSRALVSASHTRLFLDAVPVASPRSEKAASALRRLGCRTRPVPEDWIRLITSISQSVGTEGIVSNADRSRLFHAYTELRNGIPDRAGLSGWSFILGRDGHLHDPSQVFVDDYPQLAELLGAAVPIAADLGQGALGFYDSYGVKRLSEAAILSRTEIGDPQEEPNRIGATKTRRQLDSGSFRSALSALINREISERASGGATPVQASQLPRIQSMVFVDSISREYELAGINVTLAASHLWNGTTLYVVSPQTRSVFRDTVSYALAEVVADSSSSARMLVSAIYRLLECGSTEEIAGFLAHRGIPWQSDLPFEAWELEREADRNEEDQQADGGSIAEQIRDSLTANLMKRADRAATDPSPSSDGASTTDREPKGQDLPPIEEVVAQEVTLAGTHISVAGGGGAGGGGGGSGWSPRDPERDRLLGERGEKVVYLRELERVRDAGHKSPESLVAWVSRDNPTTDHDIRSIADDGTTLWIEVKSTSGLDGNFDWPESEVARAMAVREHYVLCRVYRVDSKNPLIKRFHDPLSMLEAGHMRLGLGSIRAQVESAETTQ